MNVLSLFGGIEGGRAALDLLGITPDRYFSAEVDPYPVKISSANYPDIIHLGDVTKLSVHRYDGYSVLKPGERKNGFLCYNDHTVYKIDLLLGGPPCQDLSIAKKNGKGLEGEKSKLFYEFVRILNEVKPKYFLMENVASMKRADEAKITEILGVKPIMINSNLVSAQNRKRLYWVGKLNESGTYDTVDIPQPEDKGIFLRDILEDIPMDDPSWKILDEKYLTPSFFEKIAKGTMSLANIHPSGKGMNGNIHNVDTKSPTLTTNKGEGPKIVLGQFRRGAHLRIHADQENSPTLTSNMGTGGNNVPVILGLAHRNRGEGKAPECNMQEKANSMTTVQSDSEILGIFQKPRGKNSGGITYDGEKSPTITGSFEDNSKLLAVQDYVYLWRKLTPIECERLQTLPDNYTACVSNSRRYKAIGNGWTVKVIAHIFSFIVKKR